MMIDLSNKETDLLKDLLIIQREMLNSGLSELKKHLVASAKEAGIQTLDLDQLLVLQEQITLLDNILDKMAESESGSDPEPLEQASDKLESVSEALRNIFNPDFEGGDFDDDLDDGDYSVVDDLDSTLKN